MGAKQSSPAANGRTRAYSGSDLPSSTSTTSNGNGRTAAMAMSYHAYGQSAHGASGTTATSSQHIGPRTRSTERDRSSSGQGGPRLLIGSLPAHLSPHLFGGKRLNGPLCSSFTIGDYIIMHRLLPLTHQLTLTPFDVLSKDAGECAICLEELVQGDTIARLPCLCIYHKGCIDEWFEVNRSCPEHPSD
uniref:E3 ubiquitin-protein ligase ZNRF1 n=1 Tax=Salmo trutta TaxID=8032 RepID=A0A674B5W8_SALTR